MDFAQRFVVFDTSGKFFTEVDFFAEIDPVFFVEFGHFGEGRFARLLEIIVPNGGNSEIVIIPEFALVACAIRGDGGIFRIDRVSLAIFIEEVR